MSKEQYLSILRHFLTFAGGVLVVQGVLDEAMWAELSGAAMTLVGGIWGVISKKETKKEGA